MRSICESVCSDGSSATVQPGGSNQRPRMDIACVLDITQTSNIAHRKRALEEVRLASELVNANLHHIHVSALFSYEINLVLLNLNLLVLLSVSYIVGKSIIGWSNLFQSIGCIVCAIVKLY